MQLDSFTPKVIEKQLGPRNPLGMDSTWNDTFIIYIYESARLKAKDERFVKMLNISCTCYSDNIRQLVSRLKVIVFLNELGEGYINMKLVWVRVLRGAFQIFNGLRANLEVLLLKANKYDSTIQE